MWLVQVWVRVIATAVGVAVELLTPKAGERSQHLVQLRIAPCEAADQQREERHHPNSMAAVDALTSLLDREKMARPPVEVGDQDVVEAVRCQSRPQIGEQADIRRGAELQRAPLRNHVGCGIDEGEL